MTGGRARYMSLLSLSVPQKIMFSSIGLMTLVVATAEIGDKTQLLALCLAARFRTQLPIVLGIFAATVLNHLLASMVGVSLASILTPEILRWVLTISFALMAYWMLVPDKLDDMDCPTEKPSYSVFFTTAFLFFMAEMGDKTQLATVAMAAHYQSVGAVVFATTLGMLIADVPAVYIGDKLSQKLSLVWMRRISAAVFVALAVASWLTPLEQIRVAG